MRASVKRQRQQVLPEGVDGTKKKTKSVYDSTEMRRKAVES